MSVKLSDPLGRTAFVNARLLDPATGLDKLGALLIEGEAIADVSPSLFRSQEGWDVPGGIRKIDCQGLCLAPGLVDMRVSLGEPGQEHKGTLASAGTAAAASGITSMVCLPDTDPVIDDMSVVEFVARRARKLGLTKVYPYGAITKGLKGKELSEMGLLAESGAVAFTDATHAVADSQVMRRALDYAGTFNLLIVQHPEDPSLAKGGHMTSGETATRLGLSGIPAQAEVIIIERDLRLAEVTDGRIHFAHISTADSVDAVRRAKERGIRVTCDTAPPYFSMNELAIGDYRTFTKLSPPLRPESDRQAIIEGLQDGTIDAIASDHTPQDEESKRLPFGQAAYGGIGLDTLLSVSLELFHNEYLTMLQMLDLLTAKPASLLNLPAGRLEKGLPADLFLFDPDTVWKVDAHRLLSKSKNTPFDGRPVQGRVIRTVIDGRTVFEAASHGVPS